MEVALDQAATFYIFKPVMGYRNHTQLEKKLKDLRKKDLNTTPSPDFERSIPQIRDFADYMQNSWYLKLEKLKHIGPELEVLWKVKIRPEYYRNWMKINFDPGVELRFKEFLFQHALEIELAIIVE